MTRPGIVRRFNHDCEGATAVEFALVFGIFLMLMLGIIEYGLIMFTKVAIESSTQQVARTAGIGTVGSGCPDAVCQLKKNIEDKTLGLVDAKSVVVTATVISDSTTPTPVVPDICMDDSNNPYPSTCQAYQDNNANGQYDEPGNNTVSVGKAGDIVEIRVTYLWRVFFPIFRSYFGKNGALTITSSTVVKNEP